MLLPSLPLSERRRYCVAWRLCVCVSAELWLHVTLVSVAKVTRCIRCSLVSAVAEHCCSNWIEIENICRVSLVSCNPMDRECRMAGWAWVLPTGWCQGSYSWPASTQPSGTPRHHRRPPSEGTHLLWGSRLGRLAATEGRVYTSPAEWGRYQLFRQWVDAAAHFAVLSFATASSSTGLCNLITQFWAGALRLFYSLVVAFYHTIDGYIACRRAVIT